MQYASQKYESGNFQKNLWMSSTQKSEHKLYQMGLLVLG